jgi:hypothetical protein
VFAWNDTWVALLKKLGFKQSKFDPCVFMRNRNGKILMLSTWVDDAPLVSNDKQEKESFLAELRKVINIKCEPMTRVLGMRVTRDLKAGEIRLDQSEYVSEVLERFNLPENEMKSVETPADTEILWPEDETSPMTEEDWQKMKKTPYKQAVGCLHYLAAWTRPDIAPATTRVASFQKEPRKHHWAAVKRVLKYLNTYPDLCITYKASGKKQMKLEGFADASHGATWDGRSTTGWIFYTNGPISWRTHLQESRSKSATQAEYQAVSDAGGEALWMRGLLGELGYEQKERTIIWNDNKGTVDMTRRELKHETTKHIRIHHHIIQEWIHEGEIEVRWMEGKEMVADILTKPLGSVLHEKHLTDLMAGPPVVDRSKREKRI